MGNRFGSLEVIEELRGEKSWDVRCRCKCDCGNEVIVLRSNLRQGRTKSCGCMSRKLKSEANKKVNEFVIDEDRNIAIGKATNTGSEFLIDLEDYERVRLTSWYEANTGYLMHKEKGKRVVSLHRFITSAPDGMVVDHINHDRKDNRKSNLRVCTQRVNAQNRASEPVGITVAKRGNCHYYLVQLFGKYRGCFKDYQKAKELRDEIIARHGCNYLEEGEIDES